jgi:ribose 5-phosphate isomerase B
MEKIAISSDHGGYILKEIIKLYLQKKEDLEVIDLGTNSEESVDYPVYGKKTAEAVASGATDRGIVICGTGIGISIAANKIKGIRAANCTSVEMAEMSRKHNNANVLALGGRLINPELAKQITETWLTTEFEGDRHQRRVDQISELEK